MRVKVWLGVKICVVKLGTPHDENRGMAVATLLLLAAALAVAAPDWTDCPTPCRCKWASGKKTASCRDGPFTGLPDTFDGDMQVLDLAGNSIHKLGKDAFQRAGLLNLQRIFLKGNTLREVHRDAFRELIILVEVDLSNNEITSLDPETFSGNERLRVLYLSGNPLGQLVEGQFPPLPHLRTLDFESCRLEKINPNAFVNLVALESLNLKGNKLANLSEETLMNFAHLKSLALDGNPWKCDCDLRGFRDWFLSSNLRSMSLGCAEPEELRDHLWEDVPSEQFACAPQVYLTPYPQVQAEAGGNVSFGCHVLGDPEPEVTWMYEGRPINHTWLIVEAEEGLLDKWVNISVVNVSDADAGVYSCVARNSLATLGRNVTLVLPEVVTATTLSKSDPGAVWWASVAVGIAVTGSAICTLAAVCCMRAKNARRRRQLKASVSFTDQEKKLLDVSIATTTDRGAGSCEALPPDGDGLMDSPSTQPPPVHITIESHHRHDGMSLPPMPMAVYPPPPEFSSSVLPSSAYGNIFISVAVSRDPTLDASRCPDLLDLPHRAKPVYHGMATLPRRPQHSFAAPKYDNMGPRVTAGGSSTLSLPDADVELPPPPPPPSCTVALTPDFVSL